MRAATGHDHWGDGTSMGPTVGLLVFEERCFSTVRADVMPWLQTFCRGLQVDDHGAVDFWVDDPSAVGAGHVDPRETCLFELCENDEHWYDEDYGLLPRQPVQELIVWAGCKANADHLLLGHLALELARRYDAYIDFTGDIGGDWLRELTDPSPQQRQALRDYEQTPLTSLPGRLWDFGFHVADPDFLAAWLRHPRFHMVK